MLGVSGPPGQLVKVDLVTRALRADAARNRSLLLAAATEEFAAHGMDASVADIARRAGVAKGTVFRHFATKEDLIASIVSEHLAALTAAARQLAGSADPATALLEFLTIAADHRRQHDLTFLQSVSEGDTRVTDVRDQLVASLGVLVDEAREARVIRSDITTTDVFLLMCAPVHVVDNLPNPPAGLWRRYLAIIFDGLRPEGATPLPEAAPSYP